MRYSIDGKALKPTQSPRSIISEFCPQALNIHKQSNPRISNSEPVVAWNLIYRFSKSHFPALPAPSGQLCVGDHASHSLDPIIQQQHADNIYVTCITPHLGYVLKLGDSLKADLDFLSSPQKKSGNNFKNNEIYKEEGKSHLNSVGILSNPLL